MIALRAIIGNSIPRVNVLSRCSVCQEPRVLGPEGLARIASRSSDRFAIENKIHYRLRRVVIIGYAGCFITSPHIVVDLALNNLLCLLSTGNGLQPCDVEPGHPQLHASPPQDASASAADVLHYWRELG